MAFFCASHFAQSHEMILKEEQNTQNGFLFKRSSFCIFVKKAKEERQVFSENPFKKRMDPTGKHTVRKADS